MEAPSLRLQMRRDYDYVISGDILEAAGRRIQEEADEEGIFRSEFEIEDEEGSPVHFDISCRLFYEPSFDGGKHCSGVIFYFAGAETYDQDGNSVSNDFTREELEDYIKY